MTDRPIDPATLVAAVEAFFADRDARMLDAIRCAVAREIDASPPDALAVLSDRLAATGADWTYYPPDPLARRIHHAIADILLPPESALFGVEHATALRGPVVIVANHLSYADANLLEILMHRAAVPLAERLTVTAGPKVYSTIERRFSSLCFGTIKTPQSSAVSSGAAVMQPRDVARAARRSIEAAHARLCAGDALLVFGEGTRSRSTSLQPMLPAVTRYFDGLDTAVLPVAISGTDAMFPIGDNTLRSVPIVARMRAPVGVRELNVRARGDRRVMMDAIGVAIAAMLPSEYRGVYADAAASSQEGVW